MGRKPPAKKREEAGVAVSVSERGIKARISNAALARLGSVAAWLFPHRDAKVRITAALAARVAKKIQKGAPLDEQEQYFVSLLFEKQARQLANTQAVAARVIDVMPEVANRLKSPPTSGDSGSTLGFMERAESIAAEITDEVIRDLFSRVIAGELMLPGVYSVRTLETVRLMDQRAARLFDSTRMLVFDGAFIVNPRFKPLLSRSEFSELEDAGLVVNSEITMALGETLIWRYGAVVLRVTCKHRHGLRYETIRLTRSGREIVSVLGPIKENLEYVRRLAVVMSEGAGEDHIEIEWQNADGTWQPVLESQRN